MSRFTAIPCLLALPWLAACAADPATPDDRSNETELAADSSVSAHVPGMTVWVAPTVVAEWRYEQWVWVLRGRTSKNLESAFSYSSDDEFGETLITSKRKFEFVVDGMSMVELLKGHPLHIHIETTTGTQKEYFASIHMAPRFGDFVGSSKVFIHTPIEPIVAGGVALFRSRATTASGTGPLTVSGPIARPESVVGTGHEYVSDFTWANLLLTAAPPADPIAFTAGAFVKKADVEFAVDDLVLSTTAPDIGEPCSDTVLACLKALPDAAGDTSSCGDARDVGPCMASLGPIAANSARFANDLALYLASWYPDHNVAGVGGAPLMQAQAEVHADLVKAITSAGQDPHGHDLSKFTVLSHPDPVLPNSTYVWFGAYDKSTAALESIYWSN